MKNFYKLIFVFLFLISVNNVFGQEEVGYFYDVSGTPIDGELNTFEYSPKEGLFINHQVKEFEKGVLYKTNGERLNGYIKLEKNIIRFKEDYDYPYSKNISMDGITSLKVGVDSFFVVPSFNIEKKLVTREMKRKGLFHFIAEVEGYVFALHYNFDLSSYVKHKTYHVKEANGYKWSSFPQRKADFKFMALKYFYDIPYLKDKIMSGEFNHKNLRTMIKMADYYARYKKNRAIYFDKYWQEIEEASDAVYHAKVVDKQDSIWTLNYYDASRKLYSIQYSSFYPNRKNGLYTSFYENGNKRKEIAYENDVEKEITTFYENGGEHIKYRIIEYENDYYKNEKWVDYEEIKDTNGKNLIPAKSVLEHALQNRNNEDSLVMGFENKKLKYAYRNSHSRKLYQIVDPNYKFKIKKIKSKWFDFKNKKSSKKFIQQAVKDNVLGTALILFRTTYKGEVLEYKVLNKLHPELDKMLSVFLAKHYTFTDRRKLKFKPLKMDGEKVPAEFVIPFTFSLDRYYRNPNDFNHSFFMHQQMNMMNMQFRAPMPAVSF